MKLACTYGAAWIIGATGVAEATQGDCAQPLTGGNAPTAADCLAILRIAVGLRTCEPFAPCVCAPKGTLPTTASDALVCLKVAVGSPASLACPCQATTTTVPATTTTVGAPTTTTLPEGTTTTSPEATTTLPGATTTTVSSTTSTNPPATTTTSIVATTTTVAPTTSTTLSADPDGDGWTTADGDCCEVPADGCASPALVNPGALDFAGDGVDDDCNGTADDATSTCDQALASNSNNASDFAKAIDLCATTNESAPLADRRYGLVDARFLLADGAGSPAATSHAIRSKFGGVTVQRGTAMAVMSTGHAATPLQTNPGFVAFEPGADMATTSNPPADWLAANGGEFTTAPGCPAAENTVVKDPVMLKLRIRVPTNARSFSLSVNFLSSEFPEWVCSPFFDVFVALLDTTATGNPADKNIATFTLPGGRYPLSASLAFGNTGLFQQCRNGSTGCKINAVDGSINTCVGTAELAGSGFDTVTNVCAAGDQVGGGTGWLVIAGNVAAGEIAELRLAIWDTSDSGYDSLVILDDLSWNRDAIPE